MKKLQNLMLLSAAAAVSALLTVGCEKKKSEAAETEHPVEEVQDKATTPTAADTAQPDHPKEGAEADPAAAEADDGEHPADDTEQPADDTEQPKDAPEKKSEHPSSEHPK